MQRWIVLSGLGVLVLVVAIQLIPVDTTNPPVESDISTAPAVKAVLRRACYDCHSHDTVWPWYSRIAPVSWLLVHDVQEGRAELNFSTWNQYSTQQQVKKLKESWKEVREGEMPPWFYLPVHRDARLSADDRTLLEQWHRPPPNRRRRLDATDHHHATEGLGGSRQLGGTRRWARTGRGVGSGDDGEAPLSHGSIGERP